MGGQLKNKYGDAFIRGNNGASRLLNKKFCRHYASLYKSSGGCSALHQHSEVLRRRGPGNWLLNCFVYVFVCRVATVQRSVDDIHMKGFVLYFFSIAE